MLLQANTSTHKNEKAKLMEANAALMKENDELRKSKASLTMKVDSVTWKISPKPGQHRHTLIGSSISDVAEEKLLQRWYVSRFS